MNAALYSTWITMDGESFLFLSTDGEAYIGAVPFSLPQEHDEVVRVAKDVERLMEGDGKTIPMRIGRRWFRQQAHQEYVSDVMMDKWDGDEWIKDAHLKFQGELAS